MANNNNNNNNWKRIGGFSRTGTQNYVRTNDAAMGGTTFGSTDVSNNTGNTTMRIGNNAGVVFINGDIDMSGGPGVGAPINRVRNVRDPIANQDVATKFYVDKEILSITSLSAIQGPPGAQGPPGIGFAGQNGSAGPTGATGCTGAIGPQGPVIGVLGPTGANGGTGATGVAGPAGATGPIGTQGAQGIQGVQGVQGIQGSNGTILWLNPDGDSTVNQLIDDSYLLSTVPVVSTVRKVGPISVSATYGNALKMIPGNRFWNTALKASTLAVIPSGVWVLNLYANVPSNSDANQVALYAAIFMITGTTNQPSPDSLIIETKDGGDAGYYPPRAAYLPDHVKYIGRSWTDVATTLTSNTSGAVIDSTTRKLYKIEMPVEFTTLKDPSGNTADVYLQLQIYIKNTTAANQTANVNLYYQTDLNTNETTYSYLQTTFGAVGIPGNRGTTGSDGIPGSTGSTGTAGTAGPTGIAGPTGNTGAKGPDGDRGPTGPTGPAGQSNSVGRQYTVQYRSNVPQGGPTDDADVSGSFAGNANFRFMPDPPGYTTNASDATSGTVVLNDLACRSVHSSFYVEDPSITGSNTRPRTFVKGGESTGGYVVLASGKNTAGGGGTTSSPATVADITHGFKLVHNIVGNPPTVAFNLHDNNAVTAKIGMKFDVTTGNIIAANDKFCVVNSTGAVGIGGMTPGEMSAVGQSGLNRALHVCGNVMVGTDPAGAGATDATTAMILLNRATTTPSTAPLSSYPGVYHRSIASGETAALGGVTNSITTGTAGLGIISPNFITFQTGSALGNNSVVINQAGDVSVTGRANLNGPVSVGKSFAAVTPHPSVAPNTTPNIDVSGIIHISTPASSYTDNPRIKLISNAINPNADIPSAATTSTANEIRGVNLSDNSGFLRLTAQTPANSCIDLIGNNTDTNAAKFSNSVRISTAGTDRMVVNGSGNVGIGTTTPGAGVRLDIAGGAARVNSGATTNTALTTTGRIGINQASPTVDLDITGAARVNSGATTSTALTTTGRIGINQASPTVDLDVSGAAKISGGLNMNSSLITNLPTPTANDHAANKGYVDTKTTDMATIAFVTGSTWANNPTVARHDTTSSEIYLTGVNVPPADLTNSRGNLYMDGSLYYTPSTNTLTAGTFNGALTGMANTADLAYRLKGFRNDSDVTIETGGVGVRMIITSGGRVGIGTTTPSVPFHVTAGASSAVVLYTYGGYIDHVGTGYAAPANKNVVAYFEGGWVSAKDTAGFIIQSDQRIKSDIITLDTTIGLELYRKLRVVKHGYIDKLSRGNITKYGFIAQEVQKLLPDAVIPQTDFIPSIYKPATIVNNVLHFNKPITDIQQFNIGTKLKCYDAKNEIVWVTIKCVIDAQNIEIEEEITNDMLFVYGHSVDDLLQIDFDPIRNLTTAALQEVDRQQQADKARIAELEATVATQQSLINDILERLKTLEKA